MAADHMWAARGHMTYSNARGHMTYCSARGHMTYCSAAAWLASWTVLGALKFICFLLVVGSLIV